jgi:hypothetical protein
VRVLYIGRNIFPPHPATGVFNNAPPVSDRSDCENAPAVNAGSTHFNRELGSSRHLFVNPKRSEVNGDR